MKENCGQFGLKISGLHPESMEAYEGKNCPDERTLYNSIVDPFGTTAVLDGLGDSTVRAVRAHLDGGCGSCVTFVRKMVKFY